MFKHANFTKNDYLIRITPEIKNDRWSGVIGVDIVTSKHNKLNSSDDGAIMYMCKLMSSVAPMLEENDEFASVVEEYVKNLDKRNERGLTVIGKDGNVLKLGFNSDTEGNA